jgi:hypothetical protein
MSGPTLFQRQHSPGPLWARWIAPGIFFAVVIGILACATFAWVNRYTLASKRMLVLVWFLVLVGLVLFTVGWRALLRGSRTPSKYG